MRVLPRSPLTLRGKSIAESASYLGTLSVGLSVMVKDDASLFANFPTQLFMNYTVKKVVILAVAHGKRRPYYWRDRSAD